ncbi:MAG: hypothetical protein FWF02_13295 [Micrococcales bacterium]|nr:hypothetical protein [Micrococcales bacterium]MCL2668651.1 hypothetical protein [Micrococcales bacterium]
MVDQGLLEQVMRLDENARRELWVAIGSSLDAGDICEEVAAIIDERIAEADAHPEAFVTLEDDQRELRARRAAA